MGKAKSGEKRYNSTAPLDDDAYDDDDFLEIRNRSTSDEATPETVLLAEQGEVECVADEWALLWQEKGLPFTPPSGPIPQSLEPLTAEDIHAAAMSFPVGTGLGADNVSPRAIASLPRPLLRRLANLLNSCEEEGKWPEQWQIVLICLLPKADGGRRPIGLFSSVVRVWMRA